MYYRQYDRLKVIRVVDIKGCYGANRIVQSFHGLALGTDTSLASLSVTIKVLEQQFQVFHVSTDVPLTFPKTSYFNYWDV